MGEYVDKKEPVPAHWPNSWSLPCRRCLFVTGRGLDRPLWARSSLYCVSQAQHSSAAERVVGVFRLEVLRYNHMTVGKSQPKTAVVKIR